MRSTGKREIGEAVLIALFTALAKEVVEQIGKEIERRRKKKETE
jgi:hypothetical protein